MSKRRPKDMALRDAFVRLLSEVRQRDKNLTVKKITEVLHVKRQTLWLYERKRVTPGGEVIKRACDYWKAKLTVKGFEFSGSAFETTPRVPRESLPTQRSLFDLLETLTSRNLEAKIVGRVGDSFCLQIRIREAS